MSVDEERFQRCITRMKAFLKDQNVSDAVSVAKEAYRIRNSEKLKVKIEKMENYLLEQENYSDGEDVVELGNGFYISTDLGDELYPYQKQGVLWMYSLFEKQKGGILADDMGLGKTIQAITFLTGLFEMQKIRHALIIMPPTLINNWLQEFDKWSPSLYVCQYQGEARSRKNILTSLQRKEGILITTYGLVTTSHEELSSFREREFVWDVVILDEGHKIKNPTKCRTAVNNILAKIRIILTGTPIQNNLSELWSLFDYAHHGTLLGTHKTFKSEYGTPITRSREKNATASEKRYGEEMARVLMDRVQPYLLRRTKTELLNKSTEKERDIKNSDVKDSKLPKPLVQKNDFVVWLPLTPNQIRIYDDFIHLERVKEVLMTKRSPLVELTILKKLCDHPRLLSAAACSHLGLDGDNRFVEDDDHGPKLRLDHVSDETLISESGKLGFCLNLVRNFKNEGNRTLIFSQSRKMLDIIQRVLERNGFRLLRLDGSITKQSDRKVIIDKFENNSSYNALLLTVQVGGVGLNLTSANRVIIYDPSWNPATDSQAIDRAYRIGQTKSVIVYRLITCATVEEKIYRRQVFKESIYKETTGGCRNTYRYFTSFELKDMFTLENPEDSPTQRQLEKLHSQQRKTNTLLDEHIATLYSFGVFGISDNDLLFSVKEEENEPLNVDDKTTIDTMKSRATKLIEMECELTDRARVDQGLFKTPQLPTYNETGRRKPGKQKGVEWTTPATFGAAGDDVGSLVKDFINLEVSDDQKRKDVGRATISIPKQEDFEFQKPIPMPNLNSSSPVVLFESNASSETKKVTSTDSSARLLSRHNFDLPISPILANRTTLGLDTPDRYTDSNDFNLLASTPMISSFDKKKHSDYKSEDIAIADNLEENWLHANEKAEEQAVNRNRYSKVNKMDVILEDTRKRHNYPETHKDLEGNYKPEELNHSHEDAEGSHKHEELEESDKHEELEDSHEREELENSHEHEELEDSHEHEELEDSHELEESGKNKTWDSLEEIEGSNDEKIKCADGFINDSTEDHTNMDVDTVDNTWEASLSGKESGSESERENDSSGITINETQVEESILKVEGSSYLSFHSSVSDHQESSFDDSDKIIKASKDRRKSLVRHVINRIYSDEED